MIDRILSSDILPDNIVSSVNYMCSINDVKVVNELYNIVEQNANKALSIADRAYVLETGRITLQGTADELLHDDKVRAAYLGE